MKGRPSCSTCHGRAPARDSAAGTSAGPAGGNHRTRRMRSGVMRFSAGMASSSDRLVNVARTSSSRRAAAGSRSAQDRIGGGAPEGSEVGGQDPKGRACATRGAQTKTPPCGGVKIQHVFPGSFSVRHRRPHLRLRQTAVWPATGTR